MAQQDLTTLIPRLRRAIDGPGDGLATPLDDGQIEAAAADAIADVILYTGGLFGHTLVVLDRDDTYAAPNSWAVDPELTPEEETVIVAQAAINFFFHYFRGLKVSESIANEGQTWEYSLSANVVKAQFDELVAARDRALAAVERNHPVPTAFASFLEGRDYYTAQLIEPWTRGSGLPVLPQLAGGLESVERFGP